MFYVIFKVEASKLGEMENMIIDVIWKFSTKGIKSGDSQRCKEIAFDLSTHDLCILISFLLKMNNI